jgi:hypothetical protein
LACERGQALILVVASLPIFFAVALVGVDGTQGLLQRQVVQTAADAAALAAAGETAPALDPSCVATQPCFTDTRTHVAATASQYLTTNGVTVTGPLPACGGAQTTNCYTWPYPADGGPGSPSRGRVEIRTQAVTHSLFAGIAGIAPDLLKPSARAVAGATGRSTQHCVFTGVTIVNPDQYLPNCTIQGNFGPGVSGAEAFTMSRACDAIFWTGSATGNPTLGALGTNGGMTFSGADGKRVKALGSNQSGCGTYPTPPGTPCTATAWGDPSDPPTIHTCVKTLVDLSSQVPLNWQVTTTVPALLPPGTPFNPATDYGVSCVNLGTGNVTFTPATTYTPPDIHGNASGPPGVYCVTGAGSVLTPGTGGSHDFEHFGSREGYTFYALSGASISVASNGTDLAFYWPSACGATRPTTRPASFSCFSRTITGYDPQTMLYATNPTHDDSNCNNDAICVNGNGTTLNGDVFAMSPGTFPPPNPTTTGGTIFMAGGNATAGSGFLQSWWLTVQGNNGTYTGTGPSVGDTCDFSSAHQPGITNPSLYAPGCQIQGTPTPAESIANLGMQE